MDEYQFYQLNEHVTIIQENEETTVSISEPQLELMAILRVRIECYR